MAEVIRSTEDRTSLVSAAILKARMENPHCPMALLMGELMEQYRLGDNEALKYAISMAEETLAPQKPSIFERINIRIKNHHQQQRGRS